MLKKLFVFSFVYLLLSAENVSAQPRFSFEIGAGSSFLPNPLFYEQTTLAYRLPFFQDKMDIFCSANYQILPIAKTGLDQFSAGGKYYFINQGLLQPYIKLGLAWLPIRQDKFGIVGGGGLELVFNQNHAISVNTSAVIPPTHPSLMLINADLNYKLSFFINQK